MNDREDRRPEFIPSYVEIVYPHYASVETEDTLRDRPLPALILEPPRRRKVVLPIVLFVVTFASTVLAGLPALDADLSLAKAFTEAFKYALPVMTILFCHEMGHFLQSRRYGVYSSFPFFIPMPFSPIGTMGAVIAMDGRLPSRRALFDIGISGPLAGLVPTLICCFVGLKWSTVVFTPVPNPDELHRGMPLLFQYLLPLFGKTIPPLCSLNYHPVAFAGWVGLLITSLNLIPVGQLDGGHVLYALLRRKAHTVAILVLWAAAFAVVFFKLYGWLVMIFLVSYMGPKHPPTRDDDEPLGWFRILLGWLTLAFIPLGFIPQPFLMQ